MLRAANPTRTGKSARLRTALPIVLVVRLVIAKCSVDYAGRLSAHLPLATRLLIVKADSSVRVHSDGGSYKPLNWMSPPCRLAEEPGRWVVVSKGGEELRITIEDVLHDS